MTDIGDLGNGWKLTHLINLNPGWQANASNDEYVVVASGATIEDAINFANEKIEKEDFAGTKFHLSDLARDVSRIDLNSLLRKSGLIRPSTFQKRAL